MLWLGAPGGGKTIAVTVRIGRTVQGHVAPMLGPLDFNDPELMDDDPTAGSWALCARCALLSYPQHNTSSYRTLSPHEAQVDPV